jgi:hypothetical protein
MSEINDQKELKFPPLPADLSIGKQILNKLGGARFKGKINPEIDLVEGIFSGSVVIALHEQGIKIYNKRYQSQLEIHNSQLINLEKITRSESFQMDKSAIGRVVIRVLMVITLGAMVRDLTGNGAKKKLKDISYLLVNFWDIQIKSDRTILVSGGKDKIEGFIARISKLQKLSK